jgi:hypothetical protein
MERSSQFILNPDLFLVFAPDDVGSGSAQQPVDHEKYWNKWEEDENAANQRQASLTKNAPLATGDLLDENGQPPKW